MQLSVQYFQSYAAFHLFSKNTEKYNFKKNSLNKLSKFWK